MSGSTIGGVIGAVVGSFIPGVGTSIGWMVGSLIGGYVDPDVIKGPRLTDPQQQTASEGAPIPLIYGTYAVLGTIIQCQSEPTEHKHKEGGKGGPVQETSTYTRTVAMAICRAAPLGGEMKLRRAWVNGKLAYDATGSGALDADSAKFLAGMTFYSGSESQTPNAALEALPSADGGGVGNVPAYRGLCYAVLPNCDVTQSGGAVPIIKWEVVSSGTEETTLLNPNWIATNGSGKFQTSNGTDWTTNAAYTVSGVVGRSLRYANGRLLCADNTDADYSDDKGATWSATTISSDSIDSTTAPAISVIDDAFWVKASGSPDPWALTGDGATLDPTVGNASGAATSPIAGGGGIKVIGTNFFSACAFTSANNFSTATSHATGVGDDVSVCISNGSRVLVGGANTKKVAYTDDGATYSTPYTIGFPSISLVGGAASGSTFVVIGTSSNTTFTQGIAVSTDSGATFTVITLPENFYPSDVQIGGGLIVAVGQKVKGTGTPTIWTAPLSDPYTWTKRAHNFGTSGNLTGIAYMPCDGYAVPDAPGWYVHRDGSLCAVDANHVVPDTIDLESIVGDLIERGGVSDCDVTALDGIPVLGFAITQPTTAGACIDELRKVYFFDLPEWGNSSDTYPKLRAVKRGGNSAVTLTDDDLVDVDDDEDTRRQAAEFPRKVNFIAPDPDHDYEPITQPAERESENVTSTSEITITTAVASTRDMAAPIADKMLRVACEEAQGQVKRTVPEEFTQFTTSDIVTYNGRRYRIDDIDAQDGQSTWTMTRDRASAYESNATGSVGVDVPDPVSSLRGPTIGLAMNLTSLRSSDNVPGMYLAACGLLAGWSGCDVYLSTDGGTTETKVATIIDPATMGWLTADLDSSDVLSVQLYNDDELDDATDDQLAVNINQCAVLSANVAEILQFKDATDTGTKTYDLETLTRGELGTAEVDHAIDDDFVLLDGSVYFLKLDKTLAGKDLIFRFATRGTTPANNPTQTVTFDPPIFFHDGGEVTP